MIAWLFENSIAFVLVFFWGYFFAKCLRGGFISVILGLFLGLMYYDIIATKKSFILDIVFIIGVLHCWYDLKSKISEYASYGWYAGMDNLRYKVSIFIEDMQHKKINREAHDSDYDDHMNDELNEELRRERNKREEAERKQRQYQEQAHRAREEAENAKRHQQSNNTSNDKELDPTKLRDAYQILGVEYGTPKEDCKSAFRRLMQMYHTDKSAGFKGWRKEKMEEEAKMIGVAWDTVKKKG